MRRVRYLVAMSLDGYIADPHGGYDWIIHDPEIDFEAMFRQFDTFLMGRATFELTSRPGSPPIPGKIFAFSRTLPQRDYPNVTIVARDIESTVKSLRKQPGKDIWLFGGGKLFASFLDAGLVDTVEIAVIPVLLGGGIPMLPPPARQKRLKLTGHRIYKKSGIVSLEYAVIGSEPKPKRAARRKNRAE